MSENKSASRERRWGKGQGLLEFALILPLLLLIIMAIIDFGWILLVYANVFNASREGVRYGVTRPRDYSGIDANARSRVAMVPPADVAINTWYDTGPGTSWFTDTNTVQVGDRVVVDVRYTVTPITPLMQPILGDLNLHANAARTIQNLGDAVSLPPPGSGGPPGGGGATATATLTGSETPTSTSDATATPTLTGSETPTPTSLPSATPTPTPMPIVISDPLTDGDMTVEGSAEPHKWVTLRDIQTGVQMDVEVDTNGNFVFNLFQPLVGGHTIVVQGYGLQDSAVVQGGTPTATPTNTPAPTATPATAFIVADPNCGSPGELTVNVLGYNWPTSVAKVDQIGVYWDYGGPDEQKVVVPFGSSTFTATLTVTVDRGTYTLFAQTEKSNGKAEGGYDDTTQFESPCAATFPNLQVTGLALQEPIPTGTYEEVWLDVTVSNVGDGDATSIFWVDLYADATIPLDSSQGSVDWVAINGLAAGSSITFTMYHLDGFASTGDHNLVAMADTWDQIAESDETDNLSEPLTITLAVENPAPTPTPYVEPESPGSINGFVRRSTQTGPIGQNGADVYVYDMNGRLAGSTRSADTVDGDPGYYTVGNLAPGDYVVVAQVRISGVLYRGQTQVWTVPPDTTVSPVNVLLEMVGE